jgi:hypothetical protein
MTIPDTRLYAGAIAIVSGIYSILAALADDMAPMPPSALVMLLVGIIVLVHGAIILTPAAQRIGRISGPAMLLWAGFMLGNQALAATMSSWTMGGPMAGSSSMGWDGGMLAIAVLMLVSGLIMMRRGGMP